MSKEIRIKDLEMCNKELSHSLLTKDTDIIRLKEKYKALEDKVMSLFYVVYPQETKWLGAMKNIEMLKTYLIGKGKWKI